MTSPVHPSPPPPSSAQRIQDSLDRAQNLPHRTGPIDPRDANGMALATRLAINALPDPALFSTWVGSSHTKIALGHAVDAYRDGDHARAAAWLDHVTVLLDANDIPAAHPARDYIEHITTTNAARLTDPDDPLAGFDTATQRHSDLLDRITDYEAVADNLHRREFGRLGRDQLAIEQMAEKAELRIVLAGHQDRLLADALLVRLAAADSHAEQPLRDEHPELAGAYPDPTEVYRSGYVSTPLHSAVDEAAYLARDQQMHDNPSLGQGSDPGWVRADTVFTDRHLAGALQVYQRALAEAETTGAADLDTLRHHRDLTAAARYDMAATGRTTTTLTRRNPGGPIPPLPDQAAALGLRTLIGHYESERSRFWVAARDQPALRLRSRVEDYVQTHRLLDSPLLVDLADRDWAHEHAWTVLHAWGEQAITAHHSSELDAGAQQMAQIRTLREHHGVLTGVAPQLSGDRDLPTLAAALTRAQESGYDLAARLPGLIAQSPLPAEYPLRELHYRLLLDHPALIPVEARATAHSAERITSPAGHRLDRPRHAPPPPVPPPPGPRR